MSTYYAIENIKQYSIDTIGDLIVFYISVEVNWLHNNKQLCYTCNSSL